MPIRAHKVFEMGHYAPLVGHRGTMCPKCLKYGHIVPRGFGVLVPQLWGTNVPQLLRVRHYYLVHVHYYSDGMCSAMTMVCDLLLVLP